MMAMITPEKEKENKEFGQNLGATFPVAHIFQTFFKLVEYCATHLILHTLANYCATADNVQFV